MTRMIVSAAAILALGLGAAQAADPSTGGSQMQDNRAAPAPMDEGVSPGTGPGPGPGAGSDTGMRDGQPMGSGSSGTAMRSGPTVEDLKGKDVFAMTGEQVGEVTDVLVGANGQPQAVVVTHGGFLGLGQEEGVVAVNRIKTGADGVVLQMTRDQVAELPPYDGRPTE